MVAFRWLVAVLVTVVTLFGGAFRAPATLHAQISIQSTTSGGEHATLEGARTIVQGRATKPSTPDPHDGFRAALAPSADVRVAELDGRETTATPPVTEAPHRRIRMHVEHMVFLI